MEERAWMRERALETDSHQECMGSASAALAMVVVVVAVVVGGLGVEEEEEGEEEWELVEWFGRKSMVSVCGSGRPPALRSPTLLASAEE
jgi:hypothetical protein